MALDDIKQSIEQNLAKAYNKALAKGATEPSAKNLENLEATIDSIVAGDTIGYSVNSIINADGTTQTLKIVTGTLKSDLVDVDELPTTDIDDSKIYRVNLATGAYYIMTFGVLNALTDYFQYREIRVSSIDDVTEPEITTGADDMVIYTDTSTYIGYVFTDAETPTSLGVFFGESDDFNKGYIDDTSNITESGMYYTQTVTSKIGVPNKNNEEILEYWLNEKWTQYLRMTRDMVVGLWEHKTSDYTEYLEFKADGTALLKDADGQIEKEGTVSVGSGAYNTNMILVTFEDGTDQYEYDVTEDAVRLKYYVNDGEDYFVKQSDLVVSTGTVTSSKFGVLVDGTIQSVESGDLTDVTRIRNGAFKDITTLTSVIIPSSVTTIGESAFMGCTNLQSLLMAEGLQTIGANAFNGINASVIDIPKTVTTIGESAFANNTAVASVTIPSGVTELPANLFGGCTGLTEVTMEASVPPSVTDTTFPSSVEKIYVPSGTYYTYIESWSYYADKIVTDFDVEEIPNETGVTLNIISNDYRETLNEQNGYTLEIGG